MLEWLFGKKQQPQNKKKQQPQIQQDNKWMYDFMVQFLSSPIWRVSILDFVDNKCIVFDNEEENKFEYTVIHNQFKQLVGNLVDGMMQQIGLGQEQLAQLIQKGFSSKQIKLFNQLLLVDDFLRFKDLMVKRNKVLEQEALKQLQQSRLGPYKQSQDKLKAKLQSDQNEYYEQKKLNQQKRIKKQQMQKQQEQLIKKAIELSQLQFKEKQAMKQLESKAFIMEKKQQMKTQEIYKKEDKQRVSKLQPLKGSATSKVSSQLSQLPPLHAPKMRQSITLPKQQQLPVKQKEQPEEKLQQISPIKQKQKQQSLQDRKQRLLAQREKIRKQKQQQRKKQLQNEELQKPSNVHVVVLQDDGIHDTQMDMKNTKKQDQVVNKVSQDEIKRRKQLMNKIKNRIVDDF